MDTQGGGATATVEKVRAFNRFYTRKIGLLNEGLLESEFSADGSANSL